MEDALEELKNEGYLRVIRVKLSRSPVYEVLFPCNFTEPESVEVHPKESKKAFNFLSESWAALNDQIDKNYNSKYERVL